MEMKASDLSARLLATENLSVIRARARTASFDIKSRVLTLPMWKEMTPEVEDMLIGHEVGHALYTSEDYIVPIRENPKLMGYMNIIEDVRIEKLIKRKYPGLRKRMNEGYKQLNDRDFFGTKQVQNFDDMLLIDRMNLYFKVGFQCGVTFSPDEKAFVNRAERCETIDEVVELAKEIYAYSKEQAEERKKRMQAENPQDSESEEEDQEDDDMDPIFGDFDPELDDFEEQAGESDDTLKPLKSAQKQSDETKTEQDEQDLQSKTDRAFQSKLDDLADDSTEYQYWKFDNKFYSDPVVGYKKVLNETLSPEQWVTEERYDYATRYMDDAEKQQYWGKFASEFDSFKVESMKTVNYLVKEFEMKKSAQMYKRAQQSKIGSLDMRKIYAYKLKDDLFKRITTIPQGKNHGMVILVDWSGSMNEVLQDTLKQVINLAMFCNRIQIPYRVFAFSSAYQEREQSAEQWAVTREKRHQMYMQKAESGEFLLNTADGFHLLELFSNKMSTVEFNSMARRLLDPRFLWNKGYDTSGTPLNEALVWCYNNLGEYIKNNNIEKMTFITLTDGEGGAFNTIGRGRLEDRRTDYAGGSYKHIKIKNLIKDEQTQKTYELARDANQQTETVLRMMKDRYNIAMVGFHICRNHRRDLQCVLQSNIPSYNGSKDVLIEAWRKEFRVNGFASVKNTGRDDLFIIPQSSTKIVEGELEVTGNANSKMIAKNFSKYMNVKKTSRVLLNRFVALVA